MLCNLQTCVVFRPKASSYVTLGAMYTAHSHGVTNILRCENISGAADMRSHVHTHHPASPFHVMSSQRTLRNHVFLGCHGLPFINWQTGCPLNSGDSILTAASHSSQKAGLSWPAGSCLHYVFAVPLSAGWWHDRTWAGRAGKGAGWNPVGICQ